MKALGRFDINVLANDQKTLCHVFASQTAEKFAEARCSFSDNGLPVLDGIAAWFECRLHAEHEAGDHLIVLGEVHAMMAETHREPVLFLRCSYGGFRAQFQKSATSRLTATGAPLELIGRTAIPT